MKVLLFTYERFSYRKMPVSCLLTISLPHLSNYGKTNLFVLQTETNFKPPEFKVKAVGNACER